MKLVQENQYETVCSQNVQALHDLSLSFQLLKQMTQRTFETDSSGGWNSRLSVVKWPYMNQCK
jgi:hypothetical protein